MPKYQGVDVEHPKIVAAIKTLAAKKDTIEHISKVVGMPYEVVQKYVSKEMRKRR